MHPHQACAMNRDLAEQSLDQLSRNATALEGRLTAQGLDPDPIISFGAHDYPDGLLPLQGHHAIARSYVKERHVFFETLCSHGRFVWVVHAVTVVDRPDNHGEIVRAAETVRWHTMAFLSQPRC